METAPFGAVKVDTQLFVTSFPGCRNGDRSFRSGEDPSETPDAIPMLGRNGDRSFRSGEGGSSLTVSDASAIAAIETAPFGAVKSAGSATGGQVVEPQWRPLLSER